MSSPYVEKVSSGGTEVSRGSLTHGQVEVHIGFPGKGDRDREPPPVDDKKKQPLGRLLRRLSEKMTSSGERSLLQSYFRIFAVVTLYWVVSISLVFVNKALLSEKESIDAPLFITWYQTVVTIALCYLLTTLKNMAPNNAISFPDLSISVTKMQKVMPLSVVFVAMITFNNLCLKHVGISFYYMSRSLTTVFNVILTYAILGQKTSFKAIACCAVIICGFGFGVGEEDNVGTLSVTGTVFGVLASLSVSLYAIFIKRVLPAVQNDVWLLTFYNNVNAAFLFLPLIALFGELSTIVSFEHLFRLEFIFMMTLGGVFGFAIGYVTGLQVQVTSPLTHNISGTAKAAAQTVIATQWYHEVKSTWWWISNFIVLAGSAAYARIRQLEMVTNARASPPSSVQEEKTASARSK